MSYAQWVEEVDALVGESDLPPRAAGWLYREAYYDDYDVEEAVQIAMDPEAIFTFGGSSWCKASMLRGAEPTSKAKTAEIEAGAPV